MSEMADDPVTNSTAPQLKALEWEEPYIYRNFIFSSISLVVNFVTMVVLCRTRLLGPRVRVILVSMTANDVIFSVICGTLTSIPLELVAITPLCYLLVYATIFTFFNSCFSITLITIDRMLALYCPLLYRQHATMTKTVIGVLITWLAAFLFTTLAYFSNSTHLSTAFVPCVSFSGGPSYGMLSISVISLICVVAVTVMHILIFLKIRQRQRLVAPLVRKHRLKSQIRKAAPASDDAQGVARIVAETGNPALGVGLAASDGGKVGPGLSDRGSETRADLMVSPQNPVISTIVAAAIEQGPRSGGDEVCEPRFAGEQFLSPRHAAITTSFSATVDVRAQANAGENVSDPHKNMEQLSSPKITVATTSVTLASSSSVQNEAVIETKKGQDCTIIQVLPCETDDREADKKTDATKQLCPPEHRFAEAKLEQPGPVSCEPLTKNSRQVSGQAKTLSVLEETKKKLSIYTITDARNTISIGASVNAKYSIACANAVAVGSVWSSASETISALSSTTICSVHLPDLARLENPRTSSDKFCCGLAPRLRSLKRLRFFSCTSVVGRAGALTIALTSTFIVAYVPIASYMVWASSKSVFMYFPSSSSVVYYMVMVNFIEGIIRPIIYIWRVVGFRKGVTHADLEQITFNVNPSVSLQLAVTTGAPPGSVPSITYHYWRSPWLCPVYQVSLLEDFETIVVEKTRHSGQS
ncbi:hypothetical protein BaRGS_00006412 [Batillaria attramentaria]|uniref:G-protein coupled receptors family 1 profile domain-containing protein n=1 Tax=Batillaria attramentaria TaxID=370345 RepID=A0ABD0LS96_9CAEN